MFSCRNGPAITCRGRYHKNDYRKSDTWYVLHQEVFPEKLDKKISYYTFKLYIRYLRKWIYVSFTDEACNFCAT